MADQPSTPPRNTAAAEPLNSDALATPAAQTGAVEEVRSPVSPGSVEILPHVAKVLKSSETRTPIVLTLADGDPYPSVCALARAQGSAVWTITMGTDKNERNALDYVGVGTQMGDWVYLTNIEGATQDVLRTIGLQLYTLAPDPKGAPKRSLFRLFLVTEEPIKVNDHIRPLLPQALMQNALIARAHTPAGVKATGASPDKYQRRIPAEVPLWEETMQKHAHRRDVGRESDSESDAEEPEQKATGLWFHRGVEFYTLDGASTVARVNELIFDAVEKQDVQAITELANSGRLKIDEVTKDGMTPIMWAVSREKVDAVRALIAAGARIDVRRDADNCPLLFMCIESEELANVLVENGGNIDERYEGYRLEEHPSTTPAISQLIRELKGLPPLKTRALELAATLTTTAA